MEFITGEKFQRLADVSIMTQEIKKHHTSLGDVQTYVFPKIDITKTEEIFKPKSQILIQKIKNSSFIARMPHLVRIILTQIKFFFHWYIYRHTERYSKKIRTPPEEYIKVELPSFLHEAKIIFVYNNLLDRFFNHIYPHLKQTFILISHNYLTSITKKYKKYLDAPKIFKWYSKNSLISHPKLIPLPLGIANAQDVVGSENMLREAMKMTRDKKEKAYLNFEISTNLSHRKKVYNEIKNNPFIFKATKKPFFNYLLELGSCAYSVSPEGAGPDCHRTWESLYLDTIPIVDNKKLYQNFMSGILKGTPIIFIDDWKKFSKEFVTEKEQMMNVSKDWKKKLDFRYWKQLIENDRKLL